MGPKSAQTALEQVDNVNTPPLPKSLFTENVIYHNDEDGLRLPRFRCHTRLVVDT
jgi:hypothetical protein